MTISITPDEHDFLIQILLKKMEEFRNSNFQLGRIHPQVKEDLILAENKVYELYQKIVKAEE